MLSSLLRAKCAFCDFHLKTSVYGAIKLALYIFIYVLIVARLELQTFGIYGLKDACN